MITIKEIATKANVSEGTVDRVIHNRTGVSKKTKEKILKIINENNFSVNPVASALAKKKKAKICALIPQHIEEDIFWKDPYLGIKKAANELSSIGTEVEIFTFEQTKSKSYLKKFEKLLEYHPSGVIITPLFLKETKEILKKLDTYKIPYVFLNIDLKYFNNKAYIGQDSYTAGYIAAKLMHLCAPVPSDFLIIEGNHNNQENNTIFQRSNGFRNYFIENKCNSATLILKIEDINNHKSTTKSINNFLSKNKNIKGILVPSSRVSFIADCISPSSLKNLKLIGFDNTPQNIKKLKDDVVTFLISQKPLEQGYESVKILADYLSKKRLPDNKKIYLPIDILTKENVDYNERLR